MQNYNYSPILIAILVTLMILFYRLQGSIIS